MKNTKIIFILTFFLLSSCGFKPINEKNSSLIYFNNIIVSGDKRISYNLKNNILLISDDSSKNNYDAEIKLTKTKKNKIKDISGKVTRYNVNLSALMKLTNNKNKKEIQKTFSKDADFDVAKIHSNTINNESNVTKNLTQQISTDIINFISLAMRNK
ncbi:hypothetical protein OAL70_00415 [Pelagibacteraceae bacterium]|nr:hypothetical protein [Pelagibacteraceae bacterium]